MRLSTAVLIALGCGVALRGAQGTVDAATPLAVTRSRMQAAHDAVVRWARTCQTPAAHAARIDLMAAVKAIEEAASHVMVLDLLPASLTRKVIPFRQDPHG